MFRAPFLKEVYLSDTSFDTSIFPYNVPFIKNNNFHLKIHKPVTIISGDNGTGKSTILKAIATSCGFNLNSGNKNHLYKLNADNIYLPFIKHLKFSWSIKISDGFFMTADNFNNFANFIDEQAKECGEERAYKGYGNKSLNKQSHGESFLSLFLNRFNLKGIYILDEPEAALSPTRILSLMSIINDLSENGQSQFIISTHSPILMAYPMAQLFYINNGIIEETTYDKTEHYIITKTFLSSPERYFNHLFNK